MPLLSTLTDAFNGVAVDAGKWPVSDGTSLVEGRARISSTVDYNQLLSTKTYTLQGSAIFARVHPAAAGTATTEAWTQIAVRSNEAGVDICFEHNALTGLLSFSARYGYYDATATTLAYDPAAHRWWRIRASATDLYWETSPNGTTWTVRRTVPLPDWVIGENTGTQDVQLITHRNGGTASYAEFDSVNIAPAVAVGSIAVTLAGPVASAKGTRTATGQAPVTFGLTASASGIKEVLGSAPVSFSATASASGTRSTEGLASASFDFSASASGARGASGSASIALGGLSASASGEKEVLGLASTSWTFEATASSERGQEGSASVALGALATSASGVVDRLGKASAGWSFSSTSSGVRTVLASASAAFSFGASASATPSRTGSATASFGFSAEARGVRAVLGSGITSFAFSATATGEGPNGPRTPRERVFTVPYENRMYFVPARN